MKRTACGMVIVLTLGMPALAQRRMDQTGSPAPHRGVLVSDATQMQWLLWNGSSAPSSSPPAVPGGAVSLATLQVPDAAMKEMLEFQAKFSAGKFAESVTRLEKAIRIYPQWAAAHYNLGQTYARMGEYDKAIPELEGAGALDAQMAKPWVSLALIHCLQKEYPEGEKAARRALELDPVNKEARYFLGRALEAEGRDSAEAVDLLQQSKEQYPGARLMLANVYLRRSAMDDAVGELRDYLRTPNAPAKDKVQCMVDRLTKQPGAANCAMQ